LGHPLIQRNTNLITTEIVPSSKRVTMPRKKAGHFRSGHNEEGLFYFLFSIEKNKQTTATTTKHL
jgi:hypothetical protein